MMVLSYDHDIYDHGFTEIVYYPGYQVMTQSYDAYTQQ